MNTVNLNQLSEMLSIINRRSSCNKFEIPFESLLALVGVNTQLDNLRELSEEVIKYLKENTSYTYNLELDDNCEIIWLNWS